MPPVARLALLALVALVPAAPGRTATLAAWVQLGPEGKAGARAIIDGALCPTLNADGAPLAMATRSAPEVPFGNVPKAEFAVRGCEAAIPETTTLLFLEGQPLPLPRREVRRIVMFGDTGCRLKGTEEVQDCNDPDAWPYAKVAANAAAAQPDLVIHLGDYHYRESPCPAARSGCAGTPFGYGWDVWNLDFFAPSAPLFAAAPWVLVRGNHEDCERA